MRLGRIQNNYTAEGFDLAATQGMEFIEICCNYDEDAQKLIAAQDDVKAQIARTGIDVSCVGRWNHHVQHDGAIDAENAQLYYDLLDTAIALFRGLIDHAAGRIKIAIQNCNWNNFVVSPHDWDVVLGELPELMIKFDASHAYNRGEDYLAQLSDYGERVAHVHIKGTTHAGKRHVDDPPAGMDDLNWPSQFAILYARGYDGDLSIEPHSGAWIGERGDAGVRFTRDFIRKFMV